jgi:aerobic C4-dicarboxylate transport protein
VLQVLYIAVLCGFALSWVGERGKVLNQLIDASSQMLFRIVAIVMWAAPIGAFGAIAFTVGKFGAGSLLSLGHLLITFYITCLIFIFGVLWPICHLCGFSLLKLIRYIWEELLIVLATTSSEVVLPRMIAKLEDAGCDESVVGLVIPTGYSFNLDGTCLYLATAAVFLAQATNTPITIEQQIGLLLVLLLASKGAAGVAGAAFVVLAATLGSVGTVPVESVALILGVHRLMSEGLTPTNVVGNAVATIVVAKWERALDERRLQQVLDGNASESNLAQS